MVLFYTGTGNSEYVAKRIGSPEWGDECTHCMACICSCPAEAIEYGNKSKNKPRYHCSK